MDQKTWLWKKRLPEKTIVANDKADISPKRNAEEGQTNEKEVALQESLDILTEKLASVLRECNAKDELVADHVRKAEEALAGKEKAEAEMLHLKEELNEALRGRAADNERISHLNAALKDCMQQLNTAREEQEQRVHDAVITTSKELDRSHKKLEERLTMMSKRLTNLTVENSDLNKALIERDLVIEDLSKFKTQAEAEFDALMARLDSTEKENAFLRYEFQMLERELNIQNEDSKFTRYSLDASQKQNLESLKKIKKLEAECQRLRVLLRKRLPGPAVLAKMTREVETHNGNQTQARTRKLDSRTGGLVVRNTSMEPLPDKPSKNGNFLVERLRDVEVENKILREVLMQRDGDINYLKLAASNPSQVDSQFAEFSKFQEPKPFSVTAHENSKERRLLSCGSSVSSSLSEVEQFKHGDVKDTSESIKLGISDLKLMDDFVEMEKLAIVAGDSQLQNTCNSSDASGSMVASSTTTDITSTCKELVLVGQNDLDAKDLENQTQDLSTRSAYDWLQHVLDVILEQSHVSGRNLEEFLEDIAMALHNMNHLCSGSEACKAVSSMDPKPEKLPISGLITWKSPVRSPRVSSTKGSPDTGNLMEKVRNEVVQSNLGKSLCKIIELLRRLDPKFPEDSITFRTEQDTSQHQQPETAGDYMIHVFRWKRCEFAAILQEFIETCNNLLDGKANFDKFAEVLASELSWITKSCVAHEGTSSVRDKLKKLFNEDGLKAESEIVFKENLIIELEKIYNILQVEHKGLKIELNTTESLKRDLESRLQAENNMNTALTNELQQAQQSIKSLQAELHTLKESKRMMEDQIENQKSSNEDVDTQLTVTKSKLNEALQRLSSIEVELEDKCHCCEELEGTCLELQLQLESITNKETEIDNRDQEKNALRTGLEIQAASAKLDECQETIIKLGKQLKALASPKETIAVDKVLPTSSTDTDKKLNRRLSLLDRMQFEDSAEEAEYMKSPITKAIISTTEINKSSFLQPDSRNSSCAPDVAVVTPYTHCGLSNTANVGALAIIPSKKRGGGFSFLKKLLLRKKNGSRKKTSFYLSA